MLDVPAHACAIFDSRECSDMKIEGARYMCRGALTVFTVFLYTYICMYNTLVFWKLLFLEGGDTGKDSDEESVPPLPPRLDYLYPPYNSDYTWNESSSKTATTMELELQDLSDRVTNVETKCNILWRQNQEIISRLDALEKRSAWQQLFAAHIKVLMIWMDWRTSLRWSTFHLYQSLNLRVLS